MSSSTSPVVRVATLLASIGHAITRPRFVVDQDRWTRNPSNSPLVCGVSEGFVYILRQSDPVERGEGKGKGGIAMPLPSDPTRGNPLMVAPSDMVSPDGVRAWIDPSALGSGVDPIKLGEFVRAILSGAGIDVSTPEAFAAQAAKGAKATTRKLRDEHEPAIMSALAMIGVPSRATLAALFTTPGADGVCPLIALVNAAKGAGLNPSDSLLGAIKSAGERVAAMGESGKGLAALVGLVASSLPPVVAAPAAAASTVASTPAAGSIVASVDAGANAEGAGAGNPAGWDKVETSTESTDKPEPVGAGASNNGTKGGKGHKGR